MGSRLEDQTFKNCEQVKAARDLEKARSIYNIKERGRMELSVEAFLDSATNPIDRGYVKQF
jgi:hypothetical protein